MVASSISFVVDGRDGTVDGSCQDLVQGFTSLVHCALIIEFRVGKHAPVIVSSTAIEMNTHGKCTVCDFHHYAVGITSGSHGYRTARPAVRNVVHVIHESVVAVAIDTLDGFIDRQCVFHG